jgi:hypothetical protein
MTTTVKITGLTRSNVYALAEACDLGSPFDGSPFNVTLSRTTAEFTGGASLALTASMAITWLDEAMRQMPTKGHPRASLHAVRRKLAAFVPAHDPLKVSLTGRAHTIDSEGRTLDAYTGEEIEL